METKIWYKSKRFWGLTASSLGFVILQLGSYWGQDLGEYVKIVGTILQVFGLPFTFYGSMVAEKPLGFKK